MFGKHVSALRNVYVSLPHPTISPFRSIQTTTTTAHDNSTVQQGPSRLSSNHKHTEYIQPHHHHKRHLPQPESPPSRPAIHKMFQCRNQPRGCRGRVNQSGSRCRDCSMYNYSQPCRHHQSALAQQSTSYQSRLFNSEEPGSSSQPDSE